MIPLILPCNKKTQVICISAHYLRDLSTFFSFFWKFPFRKLMAKKYGTQKFRVYIANISLLLLLLTVSQVDVHLSHALVVKLPTYKIWASNSINNAALAAGGSWPGCPYGLNPKGGQNICMEPLSNFVSHSSLTINDFPAFVNSQLTKPFSFR